MADLKFKIKADLQDMEKKLKKFFNEKFKVGVDGGGGGSAGGAKKGTSLLGGILKALGPIAILLSLKPVADILKLTLNILTFGILKILKFLGLINTKAPVDAATKDLIDAIEEEQNSIIKSIIDNNESKELVDMRRALLDAGITTEKANLVSAEIIRSILEKNGIDTQSFSDAQLMAIANGQALATVERERQVGATLDLLDAVVGGFLTDAEEIKLLKGDIGPKFDKFDQNSKEGLDNIVKSLDAENEELEKQNDKLEKIQISTGIIAILESLMRKISDFFTGGGIGGFLGAFMGKNKSVDDAIIRPNGEIIETNPNDTIIATQNPGGLGGGGKTFNFYGVTPPEMMDFIRRELGTDINASGRF